MWEGGIDAKLHQETLQRGAFGAVEVLETF